MNTKFLVLLASLGVIFCAACDSGGGSDAGQYSNDSGLKTVGTLAKPPFFSEAENPQNGDEVDIEIDISGAATVTFVATGAGCGTIASTSGANPLTVTGVVGDKGYCDMTATGDNGAVYAGSFEIEAENPDIPPVSLDTDIWEQEALPDADDDGPVIDSVTGDTNVTSGSTNSFTLNYTDSENVEGLFLQISDHAHGYFYSPVSGSGGTAAFNIIVDEDYFTDTGAESPATVNAVLIAVDALNRFSAQYAMTLTITEAVANEAVDFAASQSMSAAGKVTYIKRLATRSGLAATGKYIPARYVTVKAISKSDSTTVLGTGTTGEDGTYSLSFTNSTGNSNYFVRAYATNTTLNHTVMNFSDETYGVNSADVDGSATPSKTGLDIAISEDNNAGAFNIWDIVVTCNMYAKSATGTAPPILSIYWEKGRNSPNGASYYQSDNKMIAMAGATSDPDEYDDMVIGHEYGHFTMDKYSKDDTPAGDHHPNTAADPRLSLSEGWATFFAGAALGRSEYIDTSPASTTFYSFETPPTEFPKGTEKSSLNGNLSEVIPTAVLWDLFDESNETKDTLKNNGAAIWKVMTVYLKGGYAKFVDRGVVGRDLVDFLDGWICLGFGNVGASDSDGLKGASVGLMELPAEYVKSDLASCK